MERFFLTLNLRAFKSESKLISNSFDMFRDMFLQPWPDHLLVDGGFFFQCCWLAASHRVDR